MLNKISPSGKNRNNKEIICRNGGNYETEEAIFEYKTKIISDRGGDYPDRCDCNGGHLL